jgi:hypothetical protein
MVCGRPNLALASTHGSSAAHHARAAHFLAIATVVGGRGCDRLKTLVLLRVKPPHIKRSLSAEIVSADEGTIRTSRGKARCKSPYLACQLSMFLHWQDIGWSRSHIPVLRWSCE